MRKGSGLYHINQLQHMGPGIQSTLASNIVIRCRGTIDVPLCTKTNTPLYNATLQKRICDSNFIRLSLGCRLCIDVYQHASFTKAVGIHEQQVTADVFTELCVMRTIFCQYVLLIYMVHSIGAWVGPIGAVHYHPLIRMKIWGVNMAS